MMKRGVSDHIAPFFVLAVLVCLVWHMIAVFSDPRSRLPLWQYEYLIAVERAEKAGLPIPPMPSPPRIAPVRPKTPLEIYMDPTNPISPLNPLSSPY